MRDVPSIDLLPGSAHDARAAADQLRAAAGGFAAGLRVAHQIGAVRVGEAWRGEAYEAFRSVFEAQPMAGASQRAIDAMVEASSALDHYASQFDQHQRELTYYRYQLHAITAGGLVPDDQLVDVQRILARAAEVWEQHRRAESVLHDVFDRLDDVPTFATPPRSGLDQVASVGLGVYDFVRGFVEFGVFVTRMNHDPRLWAEIVGNRQEIWDTIQYVVDNPTEYGEALAAAVFDTQLLRDDPARWAGKIAPTVALAFFSGGGGVATRLSATSAAGAAAARFPRVGAAVAGVAEGTSSSVIGHFSPAAERVVHYASQYERAARHVKVGGSLVAQDQRDCVEDEVDEFLAEDAEPEPDVMGPVLTRPTSGSGG